MGSEQLDAKPDTRPSNNKNETLHTQASDRTPGLKTRAIFLVHSVLLLQRVEKRDQLTLLLRSQCHLETLVIEIHHFPKAPRRSVMEVRRAGYRVAGVELGMLLSQPSAAMLDVPRAVSLYEQAWNHGVTIAAFELGGLYEHGVSRAGAKDESVLAPDQARAWFWYQKGADAGEPNALARLADRDDSAAFLAESTGKKVSYWLDSFRHYTAAAERARNEAWPDEAWRDWRYRRASLARLLAREGMMQQVAGVYAAAGNQ
jgi:hypothetical protein